MVFINLSIFRLPVMFLMYEFIFCAIRWHCLLSFVSSRTFHLRFNTFTSVSFHRLSSSPIIIEFLLMSSILYFRFNLCYYICCQHAFLLQTVVLQFRLLFILRLHMTGSWLHALLALGYGVIQHYWYFSIVISGIHTGTWCECSGV